MTSAAHVRGLGKKILAAVGVLTAVPAFAADLAPPPAPAPIPTPALSDWHFEAAIDGFAANLNASVGVRNLPALPVFANTFQVLKHLEGIVPVSVVAYNENFIFSASVFWVRVGVNGTFGPLEGAFSGVNAGLTLNETLATAYGGVRIPTASPDWNVYGILGARYFNVNGTINLQVPVVGFSRSTSQGKDWADEIVGVKARHRIDDKWFIDFETDVGGYSGSATAQIYGAVGYKWNQSITTKVGGRVFYVYYQTAANSGNGSFRFQETLWGPEVDVAYTF